MVHLVSALDSSKNNNVVVVATPVIDSFFQNCGHSLQVVSRGFLRPRSSAAEVSEHFTTLAYSPHITSQTTYRLLLPSTIDNMTSNASADLYHSSSRTLAPIERLPTEMLQEIFKQATAPGDFFQDFHRVTTLIPLPEPDFGQLPLLLTRVSKGWKSTATSCPDLWSSIRVAYSNLPYDCSPRRLAHFCALLEEWLRYSKNMPLDIVLHDRSGGSPIWTEIIPVISKHAHHCASFIASYDLTKMMLDQHMDMPMLRRFSSRSFEYDLAVKGLHVPPGVTELCSGRFEHYSLLPAQGAHALRNLELLKCHDFSDVLGMLRYFPELRTFRLKFCLNESPGTDEITHEHIEELTLPATSFAPELGRRLHFPKLRILRAWGMWDPALLQDLVEWLEPLGHCLERLELSGGLEGEMTEGEVEEMFKPYAHVRKARFEVPEPPSWG